jgi:hypothetical protein
MLRLVGTCPVCERQQKVTPGGAMVHHGFQRPGVGHIIGDCFGVGYRAYELSSAGCVAYRKMLAEWRTWQESALRDYESRPSQVESYSQVSHKTFIFRRDADDPEERRKYESTRERLIQQTLYTISELKRSDKRMVYLIEKWVPAPLLEIDEEGLTPAKREERATRKTERDTKRAEKEQARREHQKKKNERLARKATTLLFFFDEFERLARQPPSSARDAYARDLIFELSKKKYGMRYPDDLWMGPDDGVGNRIAGPWGDGAVAHASRTLVELGVGKENSYSRLYRADLIPVYRSSGNKIRVPEPDGPAEDVLDAIAGMAKL